MSCQDKPGRDAEERFRQAEQDTLPTQSSPPVFAKQPPEFAKQWVASASEGEAVSPLAETAVADERQAQLCAIASDLLYWKGGLKVLKQARSRWRGYFQWQIEALQAADAKMRAEVAKEGDRSVLVPRPSGKAVYLLLRRCGTARPLTVHAAAPYTASTGLCRSRWGTSSVGEYLPSKQRVAGSTPAAPACTAGMWCSVSTGLQTSGSTPGRLRSPSWAEFAN